ncbi:hypothetical protein B0H66DRAFT_596382 [Apodospora peruviana]|uniref:Rhodopsin domain-containing protein n=1 Tax=Apodospora peruviana TaxID=516989 RepID=A0AAE0IPK2_9PEZI|nr:hypothetical protein B0H66DRAFT_596382 [Apodospora peruviana]
MSNSMPVPVPGENPQLDAETRVPLLIGMSVAFVALSTLVVGLRLYTRYFVVSALGPDDLTISIAQVLSIGVSVATVLQAKYDLGRHVWMVSPDDSIRQLKCLFAAMTIYNLAQILTKTSFLLQYRRIFQAEKRTRKICLYLLIFLAAWGITQEFLVGFACNPVAIFIPSQASVCISSLMVWYLTSVMNIVTDFIVFMVPLPAIRGLQLRRKQKLLVTSVFCLGFFTCVISIVRLFTLHSAINTTDPTWDNVPSAYWSVVELNCGILCASLPPLRPLLRRMNVLGLSRSGGGTHTDGYARDQKRMSGALKSAARTATGDSSVMYPLTDVESGSQERLNQKEEAEAGLGTSSYYWSPDYANQHSGGLSVAKLTNTIEGGKAAVPPVDEDGSGDNGFGEALPVVHAIRVTREIDSQSEKKLPALPGSRTR